MGFADVASVLGYLLLALAILGAFVGLAGWAIAKAWNANERNGRSSDFRVPRWFQQPPGILRVWWIVLLAAAAGAIAMPYLRSFGPDAPAWAAPAGGAFLPILLWWLLLTFASGLALGGHVPPIAGADRAR
ncbi:MAG: hypothetical protein V4510_00065 [bacterium]